MPLFLLWKGILAVLLKSNEARYVLGPVTISSDYKQFSRSLDHGIRAAPLLGENRWPLLIRPRKRFAFEENRADADRFARGHRR